MKIKEIKMKISLLDLEYNVNFRKWEWNFLKNFIMKNSMNMLVVWILLVKSMRDKEDLIIIIK